MAVRLKQEYLRTEQDRCKAGQTEGKDVPYGMGSGIGENGRKLDALGQLVLRRKGYQCLGRLGRGAFSRVYCVKKEQGGGVCACKISENSNILEKEAHVMAKLGHSLFPGYIDWWKEAGLGFLLSEYVAGSSMEEMLDRRGYFTAGQTARAGMVLAEGLGYLHGMRERFLFRDVKPANIMIRQDGMVKLIDLGCVCSLEAGVSSRAGTPGYAAPEQLAGKGALTTACDVYGLGRTLEKMLGEGRKTQGKGDFYGEGRQERKRHGKLKRILEDCTREEAWQRIQDMEGVIFELKRL